MNSLIFGSNNLNLVGLNYGVYIGYMNDNVNYFNETTTSLWNFNNGYTTTSTNPSPVGYTLSLESISTATNNLVPNTFIWDNYSVQWIGMFKSNYTGNWTFYLSSDDCSYFWIGSNAISGYTTLNTNINNGGDHGTVRKSTTISLTSGTYYPIRIQFGEAGGADVCAFSFSNAGGLAETTNGNGYFYQNH
jgi:hypothetical protein